MIFNSWYSRLLIIFLLGSFNRLTAQSVSHFDISYAPTILSIGTTGDKLKRHQWGHQLAAQLSVTKSPRFSFQTGIGYSFLQAEYQSYIPFLGISIRTWHRYYDLILPIHVKYGFSSKPNRFYAIAGVVPSINIGRKVLEYRDHPGKMGTDVTDDQYFTKFDVPVSAGLGYSLAWKDNGHLFIQPTLRTNFTTQFYYLVRYLFGRRSNTNDDPPGWTSIGFTIGYAW